MSHYFIDKQDPRVADLLRRLENTGKALKKMEPNCQRSFNGERFRLGCCPLFSIFAR